MHHFQWEFILPHHRAMLTEGSGISPEVIAARGYRSIHGPEGYSELKRLGFSKVQAKLTPGLLVPILGLDGEPVGHQFRPDEPRLDARGRAIKYETPKGARNRLDFGTTPRDQLGNPAIDLYVTKGAKKSDALVTHGLCAIGLAGVMSWRGTNTDGGKVALADWESVALNGRNVYIAFDSDVSSKIEVQRALTRLKRFLAQRGATIIVIHLPAEGASKVGADDFLLTHSVDEMRALARPQATDEPVPRHQSRPLAKSDARR